MFTPASAKCICTNEQGQPTAFKKLVSKQDPLFCTLSVFSFKLDKASYSVSISGCILIIVSLLNEIYSTIDIVIIYNCPFFIANFNMNLSMQSGAHVSNYVGRLFCGQRTLPNISFDFYSILNSYRSVALLSDAAPKCSPWNSYTNFCRFT